MLKNLFKNCVVVVLRLFETNQVFKQCSNIVDCLVENILFFTNYIISLLTVFCRLIGGVLRRETLVFTHNPHHL
jgi:hypothetical protein